MDTYIYLDVWSYCVWGGATYVFMYVWICYVYLCRCDVYIVCVDKCLSMYVWICACVYACVYVCACVCVHELG